MRRTVPPTAFLAALCAAAPALAQQEHQHGAQAAPSSYTSLTGRDIKALSDSQIAQYRSGEGMGFALPAELNHYPGPKHTLDMADHLGLSAQQRQTIERARDAMQAAARPLGDSIVAAERELDRGFAAGTIDERRLRTLTAEIARLQGELRYTHLRAHLAVRTALTADQIRLYDAMRGYAGPN